MRKWLASVVVSMVLGLALPSPGYSTHAEERVAQGQPVNDMIVSRWVRSALHGDPTMRTGAINVATRSGHVILKGFALNKKQAERAIEIARAVRGVKSVRDELVIMNREDARKLDRYIAGCQIGITLSSLILGAEGSGPRLSAYL